MLFSNFKAIAWSVVSLLMMLGLSVLSSDPVFAQVAGATLNGTANPYDLTRTPGGSSGGTGAAVAANFAVVGTGSDTGGSIRSPASASNLVGLRPTRGLISRDGIVPVSFTQDTIGPITRNVSDSARLLDVMAGYDPNDPVTAFSVGNIPKTYTAFLENGLKGARLGVLTNLFGSGPEYQEVNEVMAKAIDSLEKQGAVIVRVEDAALDTTTLTAKFRLNEPEFKTALNGYLQQQGSHVPVHSLAEIIASGKYHKPTLEKFFAAAESYEDGPNSADYIVAVDKKGWREDAIRVRNVREAVGPDVDIMIDANYLFNPVEAKLLCRAIEECDITWFEEPLHQNDARSLADLRAHTKIPIAAGQMEGHRWRLRELVERQAVDILQPNCCFCGGYTEARKAGHLARIYNLPIANGGGWPLFNMHTFAGLMNGWMVEWHLGMVQVGQMLFENPPEPKNGMLTVPDAPGLGLTLNRNALRKSEVRE